MDWTALRLSLLLAGLTALILLPVGVLSGRWLARSHSRLKPVAEAALALPLVLPPTVLGFYLLIAMGGSSPLGQAYLGLSGRSLTFSFDGLLVASVIFNIPFSIMPMQRAFESISEDLYDAARTCGLTPWQTLWRVELPLAWPGVVAGTIMTIAHTLGEFGVVLMVGGNIAGETRTIAISIYDRVQAFDLRSAGEMSAVLVAISIATLAAAATLARTGSRARRR